MDLLITRNMELKFVGSQTRFENCKGKVLPLKILALKKIGNLPLNREHCFRISRKTLYPFLLDDSQGNQTYLDTSVLFENSGDQTQSLKIPMCKKIKSLPISSEYGFRISQECLRLTFTDDSKFGEIYYDPSMFLAHSGNCVLPLKILALKKLENLQSFSEHASASEAETLCLFPTVDSKRSKYLDSSDESYYSCLSDENEEYFDLEPVITLKFPENEIVMKKKEFLEHCYAVKSGVKRPFKSTYILGQNFTMNASKIENVAQQNLRHHRRKNLVRIYSDKGSQKKELLDHCKAVKSGVKRSFNSRQILKRNFATNTSENGNREQHDLMLRRKKDGLLMLSDELSPKNNNAPEYTEKKVRNLVNYFDSIVN